MPQTLFLKNVIWPNNRNLNLRDVNINLLRRIRIGMFEQADSIEAKMHHSFTDHGSWCDIWKRSMVRTHDWYSFYHHLSAQSAPPAHWILISRSLISERWTSIMNWSSSLNKKRQETIMAHAYKRLRTRVNREKVVKVSKKWRTAKVVVHGGSSLQRKGLTERDRRHDMGEVNGD